MPWPDDLYEASYRGVAFEVEVSDAEFALRHQVHEFPGRDGAVVEDLGRAPQKFSLEAFVLGDDWLERKQQLIAQCTRRAGGGTLVHPYFGSVLVFCTSCRVRESNREGQIARFTLEFVRVNGSSPVVDRRTPSADTAEKSETVIEAAEKESIDSLRVENVPQFVRTGVEDRLRELGAAIQSLDVFRGPAEQAALLGEEATRLIEQTASLAVSPPLIANSVRQALQRIAASSANALASLYAYEFFFRFDARTFGGLTELEQLRDANARQVASQVRQTAIAGASTAAAQIQWPSLDDALAVRARILEPLDAELDQALPGQYEALARLRAAVVASVPAPERDLPRLVRVQLPSEIGVLELAYQLYGDAGRALELNERNRPPFPGRLPAASTVEALAR